MSAEQLPESNQANQGPTSGIKQSFLRLLLSVGAFVREVLSIKDNIDYEGAIEGIKRDVDFKGYNVYILIFSIFIASIGLNVNSTAVIIGAMLISPLMGPILGVGLSVGINDVNLLRRSFKSLGVAASVALLTSMVYFMITPIKDQQPELLARTTPTFLDAMIALFGGLAGIMAGSRKEKSNVVPGVAIATALMPPLCTAGYGLATANWAFFFGAFYLFLLNSVFISIATFLVVKYLKFPHKEFVDKQREKAVKNYITLSVVVILIPSAVIFYNVIKKSIFYNNAKLFLTENMVFEGTDIINEKITYTDSVSTIEVFVLGEAINAATEIALNQKLLAYGLDNTKFKIRQAKDNSAEIAGRLSAEVKTGIIQDLYVRNEQIVAQKEAEIEALKEQLKGNELQLFPVDQLIAEIKVQHQNLENVGFMNAQFDDGRGNLVQVPTLLVKWDKKITAKQKQQEENQLGSWLKVRLQIDTASVIAFE